MVLQAGWLAILQVLHQLGYSQPSHGWRRSQRKMEVSWPTKEDEWDFWKWGKYLFQDISNERTVAEQTPKKTWVSHSSDPQLPERGSIGIRSHSIFDGSMDSPIFHNPNPNVDDVFDPYFTSHLMNFIDMDLWKYAFYIYIYYIYGYGHLPPRMPMRTTITSYFFHRGIIRNNKKHEIKKHTKTRYICIYNEYHCVTNLRKRSSKRIPHANHHMGWPHPLSSYDFHKNS